MLSQIGMVSKGNLIPSSRGNHSKKGKTDLKKGILKFPFFLLVRDLKIKEIFLEKSKQSFLSCRPILSLIRG
jgi:hypothetical protein